MNRLKVVFWATGIVMALLSGPAFAQMSFESAFGNGVHDYFNHNYQKAYDSLTLALAEDGQDARAYYYRGLAAERLGLDAQADFEMGARLEAARGGRLSMVNDSLERIQGNTRIVIEDIRRQAMLTAKASSMRQPVVGRTFPVQKPAVVESAPVTSVKTPTPEVDVVPGQEIEPATAIVPVPDEDPKQEEAVDPFSGGPDVLEEKEETTSPFGDEAGRGDSKEVEATSPFEAKMEPVLDEGQEKEVSPFEASEPADSVDPFAQGDATKEPAKSDSPFGNVEEADSSPSPFDSEPAAATKEEPGQSPFTEPAKEVDPFNSSEAQPNKDQPAEQNSGSGAPDDPFNL